MSEAEKQEGQKTVVAFITGLLIGGLLVWVFSSSPENQPAEIMESEDTTEESTMKNDDSEEVVVSTEKPSETARVTPVVGNGSLDVTDQDAGDSVVLGEVKYPSEAG